MDSFLSDSDRDRLIAAAAELCAERGYEEFDEEEIARRAGLPTAAMRAQFPGGKEECVVAAQDQILLGLVGAVSRGYRADRSELDSVIHGVKSILELMAAEPAFAFMGYIFSRQMGPTAVRASNQAGHRMMMAMLERGWEYSASVEQPQVIPLAILGGAQALVRRELMAGRAAELPRLLPDCVYIATVPFLGQREALRLSAQARALVDS